MAEQAAERHKDRTKGAIKSRKRLMEDRGRGREYCVWVCQHLGGCSRDFSVAWTPNVVCQHRGVMGVSRGEEGGVKMSMSILKKIVSLLVHRVSITPPCYQFHYRKNNCKNILIFVKIKWNIWISEFINSDLLTLQLPANAVDILNKWSLVTGQM